MKLEHEQHRTLDVGYQHAESYKEIVKSIFDAVIIHHNMIIVFANDSAAKMIGAAALTI